MRARLTFAHVMLADCVPLCPTFLPSYAPPSAAPDVPDVLLGTLEGSELESGVGCLRGDEHWGSAFLGLRSSSWQSWSESCTRCGWCLDYCSGSALRAGLVPCRHCGAVNNLNVSQIFRRGDGWSEERSYSRFTSGMGSSRVCLGSALRS